jgi:predicted nuclease of predicted toxin-antitoxin system
LTLLCDEGVDRPIVDRLRQAGFEVLYVAEMSPGMADEEVLELARRASALLITADKDFGELVFRQRRASGGVLLLRLAGLSEEEKSAAVLSVLSGHGSELVGAFSVLSPQRLRIRPGNFPPA